MDRTLNAYLERRSKETAQERKKAFGRHRQAPSWRAGRLVRARTRMDHETNRLAPFIGHPCTDNLVCRWVDFLFYRLDLRLQVDAEKCG
jgi:hypothetical protein